MMRRNSIRVTGPQRSRMESFFVFAIVVIILLLVVRYMVRRRGTGIYIEILQTTSHSFSLPSELVKQLDEQRIRYRTIRKGSVNVPFAPLAGPQIVGLEVHVEDLERGRRIVAKLQNQKWRGRT